MHSPAGTTCCLYHLCVCSGPLPSHLLSLSLSLSEASGGLLQILDAVVFEPGPAAAVCVRLSRTGGSALTTASSRSISVLPFPDYINRDLVLMIQIFLPCVAMAARVT
jgi:hypothetical protein